MAALLETKLPKTRSPVPAVADVKTVRSYAEVFCVSQSRMKASVTEAEKRGEPLPGGYHVVRFGRSIRLVRHAVSAEQ